jgi:hypothetical protein
MEVKAIKLQGQGPVLIGNPGDTGPTAPITAEGAPETFEIWWNDGKDWYTQKSGGPDAWVLVTSLIPDVNANPIDFSQIRKFDTNLGTNYNTVYTEDGFEEFLAKEVRIIFDTFNGTVLTSKLGIVINDKNNAICPKKCTCADDVQNSCLACKSASRV